MDQVTTTSSATGAEYELQKIKQELERERAKLTSTKKALENLRSTIDSQVEIALAHLDPESPQRSLSTSKIYTIDIPPSATQMDKRQQHTLNFQFLGKGKMRFTWGARPQDSYDFGEDDPLYKYISRHHDTAPMVAINNGIHESNQQLLEIMRNLGQLN